MPGSWLPWPPPAPIASPRRCLPIDPPAWGLLVLPRYAGEDLGTRWSEAESGASLGTGLVAAVPAVLEDLARIDTRRVNRVSTKLRVIDTIQNWLLCALERPRSHHRLSSA